MKNIRLLLGICCCLTVTGFRAQLTAENYYDKGLAHDSLGDVKAALSDFSKAIALKPDYAAAYCRRGILNEQEGNHQMAMADFDLVLKIMPNDYSAWVNKGHCESRQGHYSEALNYYRIAIDLNPANAIAWSNKGAALQNSGKLKAARKAYNQAIFLNPDFSPAYFNRGLLNLKEGKTAEAEKDYSRAMNLVSLQNLLPEASIPDAVSRRRDSLADMVILKEYGKAFDLNTCLAGMCTKKDWPVRLTQLMASDPAAVTAYIDKGNEKKEKHDFRAAIADYNKAISMNPRLAKAYFCRGMAELDLNEPETACLDLSKAGELGFLEAYEVIKRMCH